MLPTGWIDLRMVQAVETEMLRGRWNVDCPYEVKVLMRTGHMSFFVRKAEEAARWREVIQAGFAEHQIAEEAKRAQMLEAAKDIQTRTVDISQVVAGAGGATYERGQNGLINLSVDPRRERVLRGLWVGAVRASVGQGDDLHDTFRQMFELYDFDGNGNLRMDELEVMVRELLAVRHAEYKKALREQDEVVLSHGRTMLNGAEEERTWMKTVGDLSARLKRSVYGYMMQEEGFQKRVAVIRSHLDISHDGIVTCEEFVLRGLQVILPLKELRLEASFYGHCARALKKATREQRAIRALLADGEDSESSDEGCLQA
jgi:Ca2+-binding EF-hand superfamily protein